MSPRTPYPQNVSQKSKNGDMFCWPVVMSDIVLIQTELPYCRIQNVSEAGIAGRQAASRNLKQLVEIGVLEETISGREKLFINPKLMQLLTRDLNEWAPLFLREV
jgi:hypothetical protein